MTTYSVEGRHGTLTGYTYGCRCDECKTVQRAYQRNYTIAHRPPDWKPRPKQQPKLKRESHGHTVGGQSPTYRSWRRMRDRCLNPNHWNYHLYGGRGITVCERWLTFENFLTDVGLRPDGHTLDRIDPDGNYEPGNVRWATPAQQRHNQRAQ